jgi:DNA-directed RNA polymerase subunit RPC12/RpoP
MNGNRLKHKESLTIADCILQPQLITECPKCGGELDLWSGDRETVCIFCDHRVFEKEKTEH